MLCSLSREQDRSTLSIGLCYTHAHVSVPMAERGCLLKALHYTSYRVLDMNSTQPLKQTQGEINGNPYLPDIAALIVSARSL